MSPAASATLAGERGRRRARGGGVGREPEGRLLHQAVLAPHRRPTWGPVAPSLQKQRRQSLYEPGAEETNGAATRKRGRTCRPHRGLFIRQPVLERHLQRRALRHQDRTGSARIADQVRASGMEHGLSANTLGQVARLFSAAIDCCS